MHANIVTFQIPPEQLEAVRAGIHESTRDLRSIPGFQDGYWLYDRERSTVTAVVVFETEEQGEAAWEQARSGVTEAVTSIGGATPDARSCEVVHHV